MSGIIFKLEILFNENTTVFLYIYFLTLKMDASKEFII